MLNTRLDELAPQIQAGPPADQTELIRVWNDARRDVGNDGQLPTSTRLSRYREDLKRQS